MNNGQLAKLLVDADLLPDIEAKINQGYFDEWQSAATVEDREQIHAKQSALQSVVFEIKETAKGYLTE